MASESELRAELTQTLGEAEWVLLAKHAARDVVVLVASALDLLGVGIKIAQDNTDSVAAWVKSGQLAKPTLEQIAAWNADNTKKFISIIVHPYVLIQEITH